MSEVGERTARLSPTLTGVACGVGAALCWAAGMAAARHGVLHGLAPSRYLISPLRVGRAVFVSADRQERIF